MKTVFIGCLIGLLFGCVSAPEPERLQDLFFDIKTDMAGSAIIERFGKPPVYAAASNVRGKQCEVWGYEQNLAYKGGQNVECVVLICNEAVSFRVCKRGENLQRMVNLNALCSHRPNDPVPMGCSVEDN